MLPWLSLAVTAVLLVQTDAGRTALAIGSSLDAANVVIGLISGTGRRQYNAPPDRNTASRAAIAELAAPLPRRQRYRLESADDGPASHQITRKRDAGTLASIADRNA